MNDRMKELLGVAAKCFKDCSNPFVHEVLLEHNITGDESIDLSQAIASAIQFYLRTPQQIRSLMNVSYVLSELKSVPLLPDLERAVTCARIADEYMKETARILSQWSTKQIGKLPFTHPMLEQYIKTANSLEGNLQFFKSCVSVNVLTKIVGDKKGAKVP